MKDSKMFEPHKSFEDLRAPVVSLQYTIKTFPCEELLSYYLVYVNYMRYQVHQTQ